MSEEKRTTRELELLDQISDLMTGYEFWRDQKVVTAELTTLDEMFIRWVEHHGDKS